jgi:hypothetical protein
MKAFPSIDPVYKNDIVEMKVSFGMDLRDYFAAKAMQSILFDIKALQVSMDKTANLAYKFADAMMEARKNDS